VLVHACTASAGHSKPSKPHTCPVQQCRGFSQTPNTSKPSGPNNHTNQTGSTNAGDPNEDAGENGATVPNVKDDWLTESKYKRQKNQMKKQIVSVVFNYSAITLTAAMEKVLNRGLKFSITPLHLDITQILVDFRQFERTMIWREFWHEHEASGGRKQSIFKSKKTNLPRKHKTPKGLTDYLAAVKSDLMDPKSRQKVKSNVTQEEIRALKELNTMQRENKIVIKPCDKGAGIAIMNFKDYEAACQEHLHGQTPDGSPYYMKVENAKLRELQLKITKVVEEGYDNEVLTNDEYQAMKPSESKPGRFYGTLKVHKKCEEGKLPPIRPIVSSSGSTTENIAVFVEHHLQEIAQTHETYLKDTPDFLRKISKIHSLPENAMLVVLDIVALYTNIPPDEALSSVKESLDERKNKEIPTTRCQME